jgi:hypothetical protein
MAKECDCITDELAEFIIRQPVFFVATAPEKGRINISPKGLSDTFRILNPRQVAFLNITGSGNETAAHLRQNGRITLMFCSFDAAPLIVRLYGVGRAIHPRDAEWVSLEPLFPSLPGRRQFVVVDISSVMSSCGAGVPVMEFVSQRGDLIRWAEHTGDEGIQAYQQEANIHSFDGLPTGLFED